MRVFFPALTELRGVAALAVVVSHIELFKKREGKFSLYDTHLHTFISALGKNGVYLFFVLSGFLITYLLLVEIQKNDKISIGKFYLRRLLRIWPVYFTVIIFCLVFLPLIVKSNSEFFGSNYYVSLLIDDTVDFYGRLSTFMLFLPNLALVMFPPVAAASQSWSVGVEEQFYLIWPWLLNRFKRNILNVLVAVLIIKAGLYYGLAYYHSIYPNALSKISFGFIKSFNIELMALGGIGAYLLVSGYFSKRVLSSYRIEGKILTWIVLLLIIVSMLFGLNYLLLSLLFLFFILLNIKTESNIVSSKRLEFLGDISYGIYMFHPLMMFLSFVLIEKFFKGDNLFIYNLLLYVFTGLSTVLISFISYRYFESWFLGLKKKVTVISSGRD